MTARHMAWRIRRRPRCAKVDLYEGLGSQAFNLTLYYVT